MDGLKASDSDLAKLSPEQRGVWRALILHRYTEPRRWRVAVDAIEDEAERAAADNYLRGIILRMRAAVAAKKGKA